MTRPPDRHSPAPDHMHGHRDRLRARFRKAGAEGLADYEMLELLLFRVIRRGDVKPLAKALLEHFGDLAAVLAAPREQLMEFPGAGEQVAGELALIHAAAGLAAKTKLQDRPLLSSWSSLLDYCQITMAHRDVEQFRVFYLDRKNRLIADEVHQEGTIDHASIYPREILRRGLQLQASSVILAHNHPSGDPAPSRDDIEITEAIVESLKGAKIVVHDHIVVGRGAHVSFKNLRLL